MFHEELVDAIGEQLGVDTGKLSQEVLNMAMDAAELVFAEYLNRDWAGCPVCGHVPKSY